jgi:subtilase family serine protease
MAIALALVASASLPTLAADRLALSTRVPEAARRQPLGRVPPTSRLRLAIGLPLRNQSVLSNLLDQLYDRRSPYFHQYLTPDQFAAQFGPTEQDYEKVKNYARSNHLEIVRNFPNRALVNFEARVADIETIFRIHLNFYQHPTEKRRFYAPDTEPTIDGNMPILYLNGLDNFVSPRHNGHTAAPEKRQTYEPEGGSAPTNSDFLGSDFRHAYTPGSSLTGAGQIVGLFELDGYTASDIQAYETFANLSAVPLSNILNTYSAGINNDEVASDIEMAIAMAPGLTAVNIYEDNDDATIVNEMASPTQGESLPNQVSCSWNVSGDTSMNQGLLQLAAQGQSFIYAVGDNGAYTNGVNGGTQQNFIYMTAVGGTKLSMNGAGASYESEVVWHDNPGSNFQYFASTGGVLSAVPIPGYQQGVDMSINQGSAQFRNVPDVAMVARDIQIVYTSTNSKGAPLPGQFTNWVGTSAAAPLFAGFIALANQQAAIQNKPAIGFLNPAIYEIAENQAYAVCFHDITNGNNAWYNTNTQTGSLNLYNATPGYDLCTGWGSPTGTNLISALVGLSGPVFVDFNYIGGKNDGTYDHPFTTIAQGIGYVTPGGTIFLLNGGSTSETMTNSKPMSIEALNGPATIGN